MKLVFMLLAFALAAGVIALLLRPLLKRREDAQPAAVRTAALLSILLIAGGGGLYLLFSSYSWTHASATVASPAADAAKLARDLTRQPENFQGWMRLGEMYFNLQQYPLAVRAFQRADEQADGKSADAISGMAESLLAQDFENIRGPAGRLFERVLEMQPDNAKALLYGALAAMGRGDHDMARQRFQRMLAQNPPPQIRSIIEKQLQAMDAAGASLPATADASADVQENVQAEAQVQVRITVSPALNYPVTENSALFVAARDPNQPGPPFAAKRLPLKFPVEVTLTAADAMLPQRQITAGQSLEIVARISLSGQPQSSSGDPFGQVGYHVGKDGRVNIVIDRLAP